VKGQPSGPEVSERLGWLTWCCPYCSGVLEPRRHGLLCGGEGRFFATLDGIHRLLPDDRRRELLPFQELYERVRRDEGWKAAPGLPDPQADPGHAAIWRARALHFDRGLGLLRRHLGPGPWRLLDVGAGNCWASARLLEDGHKVAAVDLSLDPLDGLRAASLLGVDVAELARAEAEMEALPVDAGSFDAVLAAGALHYAARPSRTLVELRRVTRRGGALLVLDSPVYRRREDGEAMVARRMAEHSRRYGVPIPRESQSSYLVLPELAGLFGSCGWRLEVHAWPGAIRERARDLLEISRWGRRTARFPLLLALRDG
jgi:SAM-dependent methyltransferase